MATDPFWDNVALLIQGGGAVGSSTLVEAAGATITGSGSNPLVYSDTDPKWAATSLYQALGNTYRYDLTAVLGDKFTFDGWFKFEGSGTRRIFTNTDGADTDTPFVFYRFGSSLYLNVDGANVWNYGVTSGVWYFIRLTYTGFYWDLQVNDTVIRSHYDVGRTFADDTLTLFGNSPSNSQPFAGYAEDVRVTLGVDRVGDAPTEAAPTEGPPPPYNGPIQSPQVMAWNQFAFTSAPSMLGAPQAQAWNQFAFASAPSMLGTPTALAFTDFSAAVAGTNPKYIMRITGDPVLQIPISSWQATLQTDRQTYLQCVIPAAGQYSAELAARRGLSDVVVYRVVEFAGLQLESEMARVPLTTISSSQGPFRSTSVVSGYTDAVVTEVERDTVALEGARSITQDAGGAIRFRSNIDWFLRPGQDCSAGGVEITVGYINYYVTSTGDAYMDVGTRG